MLHLDEGTLQAWMDRDRSGMDPSQSADVERHLAECEACEARLAELETVTARAESILGSVQPVDVRVPPFGAVMERAGRPVSERPDRRVRRWVSLAWAASVAGAVGLGWWTNDLLRPEQVAFVSESPEAAATTVENLGNVASTAGADPGQQAASPGEQTRSAALSADAVELPESAEAESLPAEVTSVAEARLEADATDPSVVRGRVTDETGRPLPSAQVLAPDADVGALTDQDGNFSLTVPARADQANRDVTVTAQRPGFREMSRELAMGAGDTVSADFPLAETNVQLDALAAAAPGVGAGSDVWSPVSRGEAEAAVGFTLLTVPGLEILEIEVGAVEGGGAVRVRQAIGPNETLVIVQRRGSEAPGDAVEENGTSTLSARRGDLLITGTATLPADSLRALLGDVR